jgi:basic amino acid/polyamine antiporter, APA family
MVPATTKTGPGQLKRHLGGLSLIAFGIGDILGAGIYVLIGKVVGLMGSAAWMSFIVSFFVAAFTGLTYAELGSRFPRSAGESVYSLQAFRRKLLSYVVGFLVLISGLVSAATVSHGFIGYVHSVAPGISPTVIILGFFLILTLINFWGIKQSSMTNIICTVVELSGLMIVIVAGLKFLGQVDYFQITPPAGTAPSIALLQGGILAFYAFIGFEDIVNVAEETQQPEKNIPKTIFLVLMIAGVLYILTAIAAVSAVPVAELAGASAPLMLVVERGFPAIPRGLFAVIAVFAVTNTALVNFIMSSRILYGMGREGLVPGVFGAVHGKRSTPHIAIITVLAIALVLALTGKLVILAQSTSLLLLGVFFLMNLSLIAIKMRPSEQRPFFQVPMIVPILGAVFCMGLIFFVRPQAFVIVSVLVAVGLSLYALAGWKRRE